jgi:molecular chaperone GrpE
MQDLKDEIIEEKASETEQSKSETKIEMQAEDPKIIAMKERESQLLLRLADLENTVKRLRQDIVIETDRATLKFAKELTHTVENIFFGIKQLENVALNEESKNIFEGMQMIYKQLLALFEKFSIEMIEPKAAEKFDPMLHEAIAHLENEINAGNIIECIRPGFKLKNNILKAASVIISKGTIKE